MKLLRKFFTFEPDIIRKDWGIDETLHDKLAFEVMLEILKEAEKRFDSIVDDISLVRTRAYTLLSIFISLLSVLITLYFVDYIKLSPFEEKGMTLLYVVNILIVIYSIVQLLIIIFPSELMVKGEEPKLMDYQAMATIELDKQKEVFLFNSIEALQDKIHYNEAVIQDKNKRLEDIIRIATFTFVLTLLFAIIVK